MLLYKRGDNINIYDEWKQEIDRQYKMVSESKCEYNGNFIDSIGYINFTGSNSKTVHINGLDNNQIIYILEGCGHYTIDNVKFKALQGDIIIIPKNTPHKYNYNNFDNTIVYFIHFKGKEFDYLLSSAPFQPCHHIGLQNKICERFSDILFTLQSKQLL